MLIRMATLILIAGMLALSGCRREKPADEATVNKPKPVQQKPRPLKLEEKARINRSATSEQEMTVEQRKAQLEAETKRRIAELEATPLTEKEAEALRIKQEKVFRKQAINQDTLKMREDAAAAKAAEQTAPEAAP